LVSGQACKETASLIGSRVRVVALSDHVPYYQVVYKPSTESCNHHVVFAKYYNNSDFAILPLLCVVVMTLLKNIQWNARTFQGDSNEKCKNIQYFRQPVAPQPSLATAYCIRRQLAERAPKSVS